MQSVYLQRNMKKNADKGYEKTKPIKANFRKNECKLLLRFSVLNDII